MKFSATVSGTANAEVSFSVVGGTGAGQVTADGLYTAPPIAGAFRIRVTSTADPTKSAEAIITVRDYDGTIARAWNLPVGYDYHTASLLPDGSVLVVGGYDGGANVHRQAIRYSPADDAFSADATLATPRIAHATVALPGGKLIVMGGYDPRIPGADFDPAFASTEIYDPATQTFSAGPDMQVPRRHHLATRLRDGKVLVTGGIFCIGSHVAALQATEIYDPATNQFTRGKLMAQPRSAHTATLLNDGRVLIAGGRTDDCTTACGAAPLARAEIFDPESGEFAATGSLNIGRYNHTATLLNDGRVLIVGGENNQDAHTVEEIVVATEIYDPATGAFSLGPNLLRGHSSHTATLLNNGKVLLAGGYYVVGNAPTARTEIFDPATGTSVEGPLLWDYHIRGTATKLLNGEVLIVGGSLGVQASATAERFK